MGISLKKISRKVEPIAIYIFCVVLAIYTLIPIAWSLATSFKSPKEALSIPPRWISSNMQIKNYLDVILERPRGNYPPIPFNTFFLNTIIYSISATVITLILAIFASYALARIRIRGKDLLMTCILLGQLLPQSCIIIPLYKFMDSLRLVDTRIGLVLLLSSFSLPMCIWILESFFEGIPKEMEEAAKIDGCARIQILLRVILPISMPGLAAVSIIAFLGAWNEFFYSMMFINSTELRPLSIGIAFFVMEGASADWGALLAATNLAMFPIFLMFVVLRKYFVRGMLEGALKG